MSGRSTREQVTAWAPAGAGRWLLADIPADARHRLSCGVGSKGPRVYDWTALRTNSPEPDE